MAFTELNLVTGHGHAMGTPIAPRPAQRGAGLGTRLACHRHKGGTRVAHLGIWMAWWHASFVHMACHVRACGVPRRASDLSAHRASQCLKHVPMFSLHKYHQLFKNSIDLLHASLALYVSLQSFLIMLAVNWKCFAQ